MALKTSHDASSRSHFLQIATLSQISSWNEYSEARNPRLCFLIFLSLSLSFESTYAISVDFQRARHFENLLEAKSIIYF